jgi:hypothetical protein
MTIEVLGEKSIMETTTSEPTTYDAFRLLCSSHQGQFSGGKTSNSFLKLVLKLKYMAPVYLLLM